MQVALATNQEDVEERRIPNHVWITCRVCLLRARVPLTAPALLCEPCRSDLVITRAHIESVLEKVEARYRAALECWEALSLPHAVRWEAMWAAGLEMEPEAFRAKWERTKAKDQAFGKVLSAWDAAGSIEAELTARRTWAARALTEIDAYEQQ